MRIGRSMSQLACVAALIVSGTSTVFAATCGGGAPVSYDVTSGSGSVSCWGYGNGNIPGANGNPNLVTVQPVGVPNGTNPLTANGYTYLGDLGVLAGSSVTGLGASGPGTWSFTALAALDYVLSFKAGTGNQSYEWAAFLLTGLLPGQISGAWDVIASKAGGLSHVGLYSAPTPVPVPGALFLFGTVLAGALGIRKWRGQVDPCVRAGL